VNEATASLWARIVALTLAALLLAACEDSKQDILAKAENAATKAELKQALGDPDDVAKVGPIETWTYEASNGEVTFLITGDRVALKAAGEGKKQ
jgi:hypothetical protein